MKQFLVLIIAVAAVAAGIYVSEKLGEKKEVKEALADCQDYGAQFLRHPVDAEWVLTKHETDGTKSSLEGQVLAPNSFGVRDRLDFRCKLRDGLPSLTEFEIDGKRQDPRGRLLDRAR